MRSVIHVPFCYYPDSIGGTEVYVEALARNLSANGIRSVIAAPGEDTTSYEHSGLPVHRFPVSMVSNLRDLYGYGDSVAATAFGRILDDERPELVHLHAFTRAVSLLVVREAKRRGIPVVFTYHTPTVSCQRGTLLRWGHNVCDGKLRLHSCSSCTLHSMGMRRVVSLAMGSLPSRFGQAIGACGYSGGVWTALRMTELVQLRHDAFRSLMREVDHVVVVCRWTRDLLLRNGVPDSKITVLPHGLVHQFPIERTPSPPVPPLRIVFLGRIDPTKGPDILIKALGMAPELPIELHLYGITQGKSGAEYLKQLKILAKDDPRIIFCQSISGDQVIPLLNKYHVLAVPSQWLETGPLVVLEAFAAGIPVLGSRLGGIAELVTHKIDGLLVAPDDIDDWVLKLEQLVTQPELYTRLRAGVIPPRRTDEVAAEMQVLYQSLIYTTASVDSICS